MPRFPERLEDHVLGEVINEWQKAWYKSDEAIVPDRKQRSGGTVWTKLLVQYGPGGMSNVLGGVLDARTEHRPQSCLLRALPCASMALGERL